MFHPVPVVLCIANCGSPIAALDEALECRAPGSEISAFAVEPLRLVLAYETAHDLLRVLDPSSKEQCVHHAM
eukprot:6464907-Amphidinium_carterae.2